MSIRALILVEGQTEERFVNDVLTPELNNYGVFPVAKILTTKRVLNGRDFKGGISKYSQFIRDLRLLLRGAGDAFVTTMLDFYRLPQDFPGMDTLAGIRLPLERVHHIEGEMRRDVQDKRFLPYLSLHEFEAMLFSCDVTLPEVMTQPNKQATFASIRSSVETPEEINQRPGNNPAAQITRIFPAYRKTLHGPTAAKRIGIGRIRTACPHFNEWIEGMKSFG